MQLAGLLAGAGVGLGLLLVVCGLFPGPRPLGEALTELTTTGTGQPRPAPGGWRRRTAGHLAALTTRWGLDGRGVETDLGVVGRTHEQHALEKLSATVAGLMMPAVMGLILRVGGIVVPLPLVALGALGLAAGGFVLPDALLRQQAAERRRAFRYALSSYLDLVTIVLAAGAGVETALHDAADAGRGWAFEQLRAALTRARLAGESPWQSFARLGEELDLAELREVAASLELAGTHGARVRASLEARAAGLRARDLADTEAQAEAATERMSVPSTVLVVGFIGFVGFPAAHTILGF